MYFAGISGLCACSSAVKLRMFFVRRRMLYVSDDSISEARFELFFSENV